MTNKHTDSVEETVEYWVLQASKGRNVAECWQNIYRINQQQVEEAVRKQKTMFARHIDEILNVQNKHSDLIDWLNFYKSNLLTPNHKD